jgi:tetratricopeptide (TPR) repeat protein
VYLKAIEGFPESGEGQRYYGLFLRETKRYEDALVQFQASLEIDGSQADLFEECGYCYGELKRYTEAMSILEQGEALDGDNLGAVLMRKGLILENMQRPQEALEQMLKASEMADRLGGEWQMYEIFNRIGLIYRGDFNDWENALKYFRIALELDELSADTLENIGHMYLYHFKDYREAIDYYERAIKHTSDEPHTYMELALAWDALGESGEARKNYQKALEIYQEKNQEEPSPCYQIYLADCYVGLGELDRAKEVYQNLIDAPSMPEAWCNRPKCPACLHGLGEICEKEQDYKEALAYYEKAIAIRNSVMNNVAREGVLEKM